jgi:hypothetical protein
MCQQEEKSPLVIPHTLSDTDSHVPPPHFSFV